MPESLGVICTDSKEIKSALVLSVYCNRVDERGEDNFLNVHLRVLSQTEPQVLLVIDINICILF